VRLKDRVAIVTGAGNGIGRGTALRFAEEGAAVVVAALHEANGAETVRMIEQQGGRALLVQTDVRKLDDIDRMVARTLEAFGQLDVLVANAGVQKFTPFVEITEEEFDWVVTTNLKGTFFCGQRAAREMIRSGRGGKIVNIGSVQSEVGVPGLAHYGSTKGGIRILTKVMARELAQHGIRVNGIGPGPIWTGMMNTVDGSTVDMSWIESRVPLGRIGEPKEIGDAAVYLASDESSYVTGTMLYVDGGWLIE
jgi:glucose 1-dehydrogenase